jgi:ATP-binding cassette subfamily C protein CydC
MIRRLWPLYRPHLGWLLGGAALGLLTLLANVGLLALSGWFLTAMAAAGLGGAAINYFTPAAIIRGLAMLRTAGRYGERVITHEATFRLIAQLRVWLYERLEPLAPAALEDQHGGELLNRLQKDIDRLDAIWLRILMPMLIATVAVTLFTGFAARTSGLLALVLLALLLTGGLLLPLWVARRSRLAGPALVARTGQLRARVIDGIEGLGELLVFGADARHAENIARVDQALRETQTWLEGPRLLVDAVQGMLAQTAVLAALLIAIPLLRTGEIIPPELAMLALFALAAFEAVAPLPAAFGQIAETAEAARRLFALAEREPPIHEPAQPRPLPPPDAIRFEGVSLRYAPELPLALHEIDLTLPVGSLTLVRGESGAGKSSLIHLLLRFREPSAGRITHAGIDLRDHAAEDWRTRIALVSQHTELIAGTLRDNLLLGRPDADTRQLDAACEQARILDFVRSLPDGYDTWIGETGMRLSGGQARRIAIARALLRDAPILLLDEPTEGLDLATEREVIAALRPLLEGRTVLLVSHRALDLGTPDQVVTLTAGRLRQTPPPGNTS